MKVDSENCFDNFRSEAQRKLKEVSVKDVWAHIAVAIPLNGTKVNSVCKECRFP